MVRRRRYTLDPLQYMRISISIYQCWRSTISRTGDFIWCLCSLFNALVQTQTYNCNGFLKHSIYLNPKNDSWSLGIYPGAQKKIGIIKSGLHKIIHDDVITCRRFLHYWPFVEIHCWTTVPLHYVLTGSHLMASFSINLEAWWNFLSSFNPKQHCDGNLHNSISGPFKPGIL